MKAVITAKIPDELLQKVMQYLRDFETEHQGCRFEIAAATAASIEFIVGAIDPPLSGGVKVIRPNGGLDGN